MLSHGELQLPLPPPSYVATDSVHRDGGLEPDYLSAKPATWKLTQQCEFQCWATSSKGHLSAIPPQVQGTPGAGMPHHVVHSP
ncbi:hypothetical protein ILYODFUR_005058 [Ilyodon furcidens]|uniref:Uncharacterized protein n=1 Tax=Ilyodon furcidens TaxID=33524 RepID=A0ABV0T845_9TELE